MIAIVKRFLLILCVSVLFTSCSFNQVLEELSQTINNSGTNAIVDLGLEVVYQKALFYKQDGTSIYRELMDSVKIKCDEEERFSKYLSENYNYIHADIYGSKILIRTKDDDKGALEVEIEKGERSGGPIFKRIRGNTNLYIVELKNYNLEIRSRIKLSGVNKKTNAMEKIKEEECLYSFKYINKELVIANKEFVN